MSAPQAPNQYPSVDLAYPLAVQSYDFMVKRIDAMEARIHSTIGLGVSLTFAIPVALSAFDLQYRLWCVAAAFGVFLLAIFLGTFARLIGHIKLMSPTTLYNSWIQYTDEDFKRYFIYHAGEHMAANVSLLEKRHRLLRWVICLFVLGVFLWGVAVLSVSQTASLERTEPDQARVEVAAESAWSQQVVVEASRSQQVLISGHHYLLILQSCAKATPSGMVRQARRMRPAVWNG